MVSIAVEDTMQWRGSSVVWVLKRSCMSLTKISQKERDRELNYSSLSVVDVGDIVC